MNVRGYTTSDGWPGVVWDQIVPSGDTLASRRRGWRLKLAGLAGLGAGGWLLSQEVSAAWAAAGGLAVAAMVMAPEAWRALALDFGSAGTTSPLAPTPDEKAAEARARVTPGHTRERCWAEVVLASGSSEPVFTVWRGRKDTKGVVFEVPLASFDELQLGTAEEWFGEASGRALRQLHPIAGQFVIVAVTNGYGVLPLARSGGSKAGIAHLHQCLLAAFVASRRAILFRVKDLRGSTPTASSPLPSPEVARARAEEEAERIAASLAGRRSLADRLSDNAVSAFLLRLAGRVRDVLVAWFLGILVWVLLIGLAFGAFEGRSVWEITGLDKIGQYWLDRPAYEKRVALETLRKKREDAANAVQKQKEVERKAKAAKEKAHAEATEFLKEEVDALRKQLDDWFNPGRLPRQCHGEIDRLRPRFDEVTNRYAALLARWKEIEGNKVLAKPEVGDQTGRYMRDQSRWQGASGLFHMMWVVEMMGDAGWHRRGNYYPPEPQYLREALEAYVDLLCIKTTNYFGKEKTR